MVQQTVSTTEELDALPDRTIVLTCWENAVQLNRDVQPDPNWWHWVITDGGPATVLWEPAA